MTSTTTDRLVLLPAVDVAGGQAVRLVQGAAGSETSYGEPLAAALAWQDAGAVGCGCRPGTRTPMNPENSIGSFEPPPYASP